MQNQFWGLEFEVPDSFGDSGAHWVQGRAIIWKASQMNATIKPPTIFEDEWHNYGWWLGLADFLSFACGALDVAEYLHEWREADYEPRSPVEAFVVKNWGDSLAVLELYLWSFEYARREVYSYNYLSRYGKDPEEDLPRPSLDTISRALDVARRSVRDETVSKISRGIFLNGVENVSLDRPYETGDSAHFGMHFAFEGLPSPAKLSEDDDVVFSKNGASLKTKAYAGWYAKLHELRRICERDPGTSGDANRVAVSVEGIGVLGDFSFDSSIGAFVMEGHQPPINDLVVSPRYGFDLTRRMMGKLAPVIEDYDQWEDEVIEQVDLQIREVVDLAHSLTYEIGGGEEQDQHWTRIEGEWQEGFMIPEGIHHKRCTQALIEKGELDHTMPWHQAVLKDTDVYPVSPWAVNLVIAIWDRGLPVGRIIGELAGMDPEQVVLPPSEKDAGVFSQELAEYVEGLPKFSSAHEEQATESLVAWRSGKRVTARELLTSIEITESWL